MPTTLNLPHDCSLDETAVVTALMRSMAYRLLGLAFLYPDEEMTDDFGMGSYIEDLHGVSAHLFNEPDPAVQEALETLESLTRDVSLDTLQTEYRRVFGHTISHEYPPYETQYGGPHVFQQTQELGDIAGFYGAFGLEMSDEQKERLDHLSVELEFMGFLAYKEAYALKHHGMDKADQCHQAQRVFLRDHLGRWAPVFLTRLKEKTESDLYTALATWANAFLASENQRLQVEPTAPREIDLRLISPENIGGIPCGAE
ncbi:MAG: molecular chaperone TorD family protein [Candidatus Latescibacteria bacterium]|nr:molecular chaperone TorD family protein [Candidatus Latescibacterota bacterium]